MSDTKVLLVGNGLSRGFDANFEMSALTARVWTALHDEGLGEYLVDVARLGTTEDVSLPPNQHEENFEKLGGAVDRLAAAVIAIGPLLHSSSTLIASLQEASFQLRTLYQRIVGTVLHEIDALVEASDLSTEERKKRWLPLNEFAAQLHRWHEAPGGDVVIYTLNYDSLLISSVLEESTGGFIYDGFPGGTLDDAFDRWAGTMGLYSLHGSATWIQRLDGTMTKLTTTAMRDKSILERWRHGDLELGVPLVVLGDRKSYAVRRDPFSMLYQQLAADLADAGTVVVAGYGFGDRPLNRTLARHLVSDPNNRMHVWRPDATSTVSTLPATLNKELTSRKVKAQQLLARDIYLPDPSGLIELIGT